MSKLVLVGLTVKEEDVDKFLSLTRELIRNSIVEDGCLDYSLFRKSENENEFMFYEKYVNSKVLENHQSSKHFHNFQNLVKPLLSKEPIIEILDA